MDLVVFVAQKQQFFADTAKNADILQINNLILAIVLLPYFGRQRTQKVLAHRHRFLLTF